MTRARVSTHSRLELARFELVSTSAGQHQTPSEVRWEGALPFACPGTVAEALAKAGKLSLSTPPDLDGQDHWLRCPLPPPSSADTQVLVCDGLATFAEIWLDHELVLSTSSMFVSHEIELTGPQRAASYLTMCFRALTPRLNVKRPRPRWRTRLVEPQQLRFIRTTLIGRTPGFCPKVVPVGPYRSIAVETRPEHHVERARVRTRLVGEQAHVDVEITLRMAAGVSPQHGTFRMYGAAGNAQVTLEAKTIADCCTFQGSVAVADYALWWPHTHGHQPRSQCTFTVDGKVALDLGKVAFRRIATDLGADGLGFGLTLNDTAIFCRGACWTTDDLLSLGETHLRSTLALARDAGMNMLRIGGTTSYESDAFYELCDELGIMVFQDFMFANMDYPIADATFREQVEHEVRQLLERIGTRPCLTVLCGGSEVAQQAAMLGMLKEAWTGPLFDEVLPALAQEIAPGIPYVPSSPFGGELPFYVNEGIGHYYGVGAYLRPLEDARRADVRFATECLAFANIPERETIERFLGDLEMPQHHPRWKERVPRDRGAAWDFEDVRDHYVKTLFNVEPYTLRYSDPERYLALGRAAVGEVMEATFGEWRRQGSRCRGALVFWLKDFWEGAGWGVIDSGGVPKSAYFALARALQPVSLHCTDEGVNGLVLHAINETAQPIAAKIKLSLYREGEVPTAQAERDLTLAPRSVVAWPVERLLGRFADSGFNYRFGPASHDLVAASLTNGDEVLARTFHLPLGRARAVEPDLGLSGVASARDGQKGVLIASRRFAQHVCVDVDDHRPRDNYFHIEPGTSRWIALTAHSTNTDDIRGTVSALNTSSHVRIAAQTKVD